MRVSLLPLVVAAVSCSLAPFAVGQKVYTDQDYAQAERWMGYNVRSLVRHTVSDVTYLPDGRVFYADADAGTTAYMLADPAKRTQTVAFDNGKVVAALNAATGQKYDATHLNVSQFVPEGNGGFALTLPSGKFHCTADASRCTREVPPTRPATTPEPKDQPPSGKQAGQNAANPPRTPQAQPAARPTRRSKGPVNMSPDGKHAVFIRDWNLWIRDETTGEEHALTTDGLQDFGYATDNAGWSHSDAAIVTWSKDGKMIATFQQDQRNTGMMYLVPVTNHHPELEAWRYPLLGDKNVTMIQPVVIDTQTGKLVRLKIAPIQHRSMECDDVSCDGDGRWSDVAFSDDNAHLAFVSTSRDHKDEWVKVADTASGDVRDVYHEHVNTYYGWQAKTDWKYLPNSNEFLWVSERTNWAQLYLYDLTTGKLKNQVTHGDGPVWDLLNIDEKNRVIYFSATGKEAGQDPYQRMVYRVGFDGKDQTLLTPERMDHEVTWSKDGSSFVDVYSNIQTPQTAVLRDSTGKVTLELAKQDITALTAAGWKPPMSITVKARDGKTDLSGYLWRPTTFDPAKKYPVVDYIYPGPQDGSCSVTGPHQFLAARGDNQSLAELGFVVVCIDGMGNPHRSKSFHDAHASKPEDMGDDTIPDQVAGIKDLAAKYPWADANRAGIWGHSGGGNATVSAMFHHGDFFKVGWSESGNHDNRDYEDDWDERWAGLEVIGPDGKSNYEVHATQSYAKNLTGKLMLVHGTMDDNVPPSNTFLVVDALMKANKNFDLLMVPNAHHGYGAASQYIMRRRWDYFVTHLAGGTPPPSYQVKDYNDVLRIAYGNGPSAEAEASE